MTSNTSKNRGRMMDDDYDGFDAVDAIDYNGEDEDDHDDGDDHDDIYVSNCHFCSPPRCTSVLAGALDEAIFTGGAVLAYSCAAAAQTFLWDLVSAFLHSREQYDTLLHMRHGLSVGMASSSSGDAASGLPHLTHSVVFHHQQSTTFDGLQCFFDQG